MRFIKKVFLFLLTSILILFCVELIISSLFFPSALFDRVDLISSMSWDQIRYNKFVPFDNKEELRRLPSRYHTVDEVYDEELRNLYHFDQEKRRLVISKNEKNKEYAIFLGGSLIFGHKSKDQDTIPQRIQNELDQIRVYNYGLPGGGLTSPLVKIASGEMREEITEADGQFFISFSDSIIRRVYLTPSNVPWLSMFPYFDYKDEWGVYNSFVSSHFYEWLFLVWMRHSVLREYLPGRRFTASYKKWTCDFFTVLKDEIHNSFGPVTINIIDHYEDSWMMESCFKQLDFVVFPLYEHEIFPCSKEEAIKYDDHYGPDSSQAAANAILNHFFGKNLEVSCPE